MTNKDLQELITDPSLGGCAFTYGRIVEFVSEKGRVDFTETLFQARGNIQPAPGKEREVLEEADRLKAAILIFTPALLTAGAAGEVGEDSTKADRIYHKDNIYRVSLVEEWFGFTKALAVLEKAQAETEQEEK